MCVCGFFLFSFFFFFLVSCSGKMKSISGAFSDAIPFSCVEPRVIVRARLDFVWSSICGETPEKLVTFTGKK